MAAAAAAADTARRAVCRDRLDLERKAGWELGLFYLLMGHCRGWMLLPPRPILISPLIWF